MTDINTAVICGPSTGRRYSGRTSATLDTTAADLLWDRTNDDGTAALGATGTLTTAWLDKGVLNDVLIDGTWVTSTGTPLTLRFYGTNDINGVVIVPLLYAPSVSATGVVPVYPFDAAFAKADWGNAATCYVGARVKAMGFHWMKVTAAAAANAGTFTPGALAFRSAGD